jgi:hypothetical protein
MMINEWMHYHSTALCTPISCYRKFLARCFFRKIQGRTADWRELTFKKHSHQWCQPVGVGFAHRNEWRQTFFEVFLFKILFSTYPVISATHIQLFSRTPNSVSDCSTSGSRVWQTTCLWPHIHLFGTWLHRRIYNFVSRSFIPAKKEERFFQMILTIFFLTRKTKQKIITTAAGS